MVILTILVISTYQGYCNQECVKLTAGYFELCALLTFLSWGVEIEITRGQPKYTWGHQDINQPQNPQTQWAHRIVAATGTRDLDDIGQSTKVSLSNE